MARYAMRISDGVCFPHDSHGHLIGNGKFVERIEGAGMLGPEQKVVTESTKDEDRWPAILKAVYSIPADEYSKLTKLPTVGAVSDAAGFKVTTDEIRKALEQTK